MSKIPIVLGMNHEFSQRGSRSAVRVVPGKSQGGPSSLRGNLVDEFIHVERTGLHSVLLAGPPDDLETAVAAVCRFVATDRSDTAEAARARFGGERVLVVPSAHVERAVDWVGTLPLPEARTWRRRLRNRLRQIPMLRRLYARLFQR